MRIKSRDVRFVNRLIHLSGVLVVLILGVCLGRDVGKRIYDNRREVILRQNGLIIEYVAQWRKYKM